VFLFLWHILVVVLATTAQTRILFLHYFHNIFGVLPAQTLGRTREKFDSIDDLASALSMAALDVKAP
jgi:hypothetical protein